MPAKINFFLEDVSFNLKGKLKIRNWIKETAIAEGAKAGDINFIFCSDAYLHQVNRQYLNHDTFTDIITFDNSEDEGIISGDIFISIDRIRENAIKFSVSEEQELQRVIIHGILHLCGYLDKKKEEKMLMTEKEDQYLRRFLSD